MNEAEGRNENRELDQTAGRAPEPSRKTSHPPRLGRDVRFLLVAVGGAAVRVVRSAQSQGLRYQETVAINGDERVQEAMDFDLRVCLKTPWEGPSTLPGELSGTRLALVPALETLFQGVTFVTVVGSLGGETGAGVLPAVLEAAGLHASFLSVFLVKPFACEQARRLEAEQTLRALRHQSLLSHRMERGQASLVVLDNERAIPRLSSLPLAALTHGYGHMVAQHIIERYIQPAEGAFREFRLLSQVQQIAPEPVLAPVPASTPFGPGGLPGAVPVLLEPVAAPLPHPSREVELLLEISHPETPLSGPPG